MLQVHPESWQMSHRRLNNTCYMQKVHKENAPLVVFFKLSNKLRTGKKQIGMRQVWGQDKRREKRVMFEFRNTHTQILSPSVSESPQGWGSAYEFVRRPQAICWLLILKWSPCGFYGCIANSSMVRARPGTTDTALPPPHCSSTSLDSLLSSLLPFPSPFLHAN